MRQRILATLTNSTSGVSWANVDSQYFVGSGSPAGHSINNHCSSRRVLRPSSRWAARTRTATKREDNFALVPSRHSTVRQRTAFKDSANAFTLIGIAPAPRRHRVGGRPVLFGSLGGSGPVPLDHTVVTDCTPTKYSNPIALNSSRNAVSLP